MEYLKIAQDLEMYGVNYFQITVSAFNVHMSNNAVFVFEK